MIAQLPTIQNPAANLSPHSNPLSWLLTLRRSAMVGQLAIILFATQVLHFKLPLSSMLAVLALVPFSEYLLKRFRSDHSEPQWIAVLLTVDTLVLSAILYFSGGPGNPFSIVYLLHVVLAAATLGGSAAFAFAALTSLCFGLLFVAHHPVPELHQVSLGATIAHHHHGHETGLAIHLQGMLLSYVVVAFGTALFLTRILEALKQSERTVQLLKQRQRKLAVVTSLSASAAHELSTPLSSILLSSSEARELLEADGAAFETDSLKEELDIIQSEAERCRTLLSEFCSKTGVIRAESATLTTPEKLLLTVLESFPTAQRRLITLTATCSPELPVPLTPIVTALRYLVANALESYPAERSGPVSVTAEASEEGLSIVITDKGSGMDTVQLARSKEVFYSTKISSTTSGMGLGLPISELLIEQLGGQLSFESAPQQGTVARVSIPITEATQLPVSESHAA